MNTRHILISQLVMVPRDLTTDPNNQRGQIGIIEAVHYLPDQIEDIYVAFNNGGRSGWYQADALMMLYPEAVIRQALISNSGTLDVANQKAMLHILKLMKDHKQEEALKLGTSNDILTFFCTTSCAEWMELQPKNKSRKHNRKHP